MTKQDIIVLLELLKFKLVNGYYVKDDYLLYLSDMLVHLCENKLTVFYIDNLTLTNLTKKLTGNDFKIIYNKLKDIFKHELRKSKIDYLL